MAPHTADPAQGPHYHLQPALLLCTGTLVVLANQVVSNQAAISPNAQLLTLVRYAFTFTLSALLYLRQRNTQNKQASSSNRSSNPHHAAKLPVKTQLLLLTLGLIDVSCYSIYNLGFALSGSALATVVLAASGQICTAAISVAVLRRQLRPRHLAAVAIVTVGLILRSMDDVLAGSLGGSSSKRSAAAHIDDSRRQLHGVLCVMLSALLFSVLGCMYELLMGSSGSSGGIPRVTQAQASVTITGISLAASLAHQALFCLPHWQQLVLQPLAASGHSVSSVVASHLMYGAITAAHQYVQLGLLASQGAMTVGLVNAVRASVVSFVSSWLFCHAVKHLCLTHWRAVSALVVTLGATQWVLAGKPGLAPTGLKPKKDD